MNNDLFKYLDLGEFIKNSEILNPFKEQYSEYLIELLDRAIKAWGQNEIDKANNLCDEFTERLPSSNLGKLIKLGIGIRQIEPEPTIKFLNSIQTVHKYESFLIHLFKSALYFKQLDIDLSKQECNELIKIEPKFYEIYYIRAQCHALRNNHESAVLDYKLSLRANYKVDEIKANLAYSYLRVGKVFKSLILHRKIVNKFKESHKIQYNTGICYKRFRFYRKAIYYFNRAIELDDNPDYRLTRGRVMMRLKKFKKANTDLELAVKSNKKIAVELHNLNQSILDGKIPIKDSENYIKQLIKKKA